MTLAEWEWFEEFATNPTYAADNGIRLWFWTGTYPGPFMQNWFPSGRAGLEQELQFLEFTQLNRLFRQLGWVQPVACRYVHRAIECLRSPNAQVELIRTVQSEAGRVMDLVNGLAEPERSELLARLGPPWYILRDVMREAATERITTLCDDFASHADTELAPTDPPK